MIHASSDQADDPVDCTLDSVFISGQAGHWGNYVRAATLAVQRRYALVCGIDAHITSDLPAAAGLSSSSALLTAFSLALLQANNIHPALKELTDVLPDGEQLVGTRGGAMDHVAILASRAGFATLINSFAPLVIEYVAIPMQWRFLVAHSLITAEKSGAMRAEFNARRTAGTRALKKMGFRSYGEVVTDGAGATGALTGLDDSERDAFRHVISEADRVHQAVAALRNDDLQAFGEILSASHASLRDGLHVSLPEIDELVDAATKAGAFGARLTGAGFGGCVVCLCTPENVDAIRASLIDVYYSKRPAFHPEQHLFVAEPSSGALTA